MIRIAAIQIDTNTAAYVHPTNYLKEPISFLKGKPDCGISYLAFSKKYIHDKTHQFLEDCIINDYVDYMNRKLKTILLYCKDKKVDLAVFPEYSIPAGCLPFLKKLISDEQLDMDIVAGSHAVINENIKSYQDIGLDINFDQDLGKAISPILHKDGSVEHTEKLLGSKGDHSITGGELKGLIEVQNSEGAIYNYLNFICIDFLADKDRNIFDERLNEKDFINEAAFIIVPAYTPRTDYFENLSFNYISGKKKPIVFVNGADGGETKIFCHFDPPRKQHFYDPFNATPGSYQIPKNEEGIVIVELDPRAQYTIQPTSFILKNSSVQDAVTPITYSYSLDKYEHIIQEIKNEESIYRKIDIVKNHENEIRRWGKHSKIFLDKIVRLFLGLNNFTKEDDLLFYLEAVALDEDKTSGELPILDEWRRRKIKDIISHLDDLLKSYGKELKKKEEKRIYKIKNYYRDHLIKIGTDALIKKKDEEISKSENQEIKVLNVYKGKTSFENYRKILEERRFIIESLEYDKGFTERIEGVEKEHHKILFFISHTDNYFDELSNIPEKILKDKCILICDDDATRYSSINSESFYDFIHLNSKDTRSLQIKEKLDYYLDKIVTALRGLNT